MQKFNIIGILFTLLTIAGCGGGGGGGGADVSGTVNAPGGTLAFNPSTGIQKFFADLFGQKALAAVEGLSAVSGATVKFIKIDSDGNQIGSVLSTATTDANGNFSLKSIPSPSGEYALIASGSSGEMKMLYSAYSSQIIDPGSTATMNSIVGMSSDLSKISSTEIIEIREEVESFAENLSTAQKNSAANYSSNLKSEAEADEETYNIISNLDAAGEVCGTVTDSSGVGLNDIKIFAQNSNTKIKVAKTKTKTILGEKGKYCFNVGVGDTIIIGAENRGSSDYSSSEFYTAAASPSGTSGTKCVVKNCADTITVGTSTTADFQLASGGRISGYVYGADGETGLPNIRVKIRDGVSRRSVVSVKTGSDGSYDVNVAAGTYSVYFRNETQRAYGSIAYTASSSYVDTASSGDGGNADKRYGDIITVTAGNTTTATSSLPAGGLLSANICSAACDGSNYIAGAKISVTQTYDMGGNSVSWSLDSGRSKKDGTWEMMVPYGKYRVQVRGKRYNNDNNYYEISASSSSQSFDVTHTAYAISTKAVNAESTGIENIRVQLDGISDSTQGMSQTTYSDGTATLYVPSGTYDVSVEVNDGQAYGSCNWDGSSCSVSQIAGTAVLTVSADDTTSLSSISIPAGVEISGIVKDNSGSALRDTKVRVNVKDGSSWSKFHQVRTNGDGKYSISVPTTRAYQYRGYHDKTNDKSVRYRGLSQNGCTYTAATTINFDGTGKDNSNDNNDNCPS